MDENTQEAISDLEQEQAAEAAQSAECAETTEQTAGEETAAVSIGVDVGTSQDQSAIITVKDGVVIDTQVTDAGEIQAAIITPTVIDASLTAAAGEQITATTNTPTTPVQTDGVLDINTLAVSATSKLALANIVDYMASMAPRKPVDPVEGARHQAMLYRSILQIINNTESDFGTAFSTLLKIIHDNADGAFHEIRLFRFAEHLPLPENDIKAFHRILNLVKLTADPKARAIALKQVDINTTLSHGVTDHGRNKIMNFFGL